MPKVADKDDKTWPYTFHGIDLNPSSGGENVGDCPFCGRDNKFSVNGETGLWRCFTCSESGNLQTFIQNFWASCLAQTSPSSYQELSVDRGLLDPKTLRAWGLCTSTITGRWLIPGFKVNGTLGTLYSYTKIGERKALIPTPTLGHHLFGIQLYEKKHDLVFLCEGLWDSLVLWELVREESNVLGTPSCTVFEDIWIQLFSGKKVCLLYDNDHPRQHPGTGEEMAPAGLSACKRTASRLMNSSAPPRELSFLQWGDMGYNLAMSNGYDVRDFLRAV